MLMGLVGGMESTRGVGKCVRKAMEAEDANKGRPSNGGEQHPAAMLSPATSPAFYLKNKDFSQVKLQYWVFLLSNLSDSTMWKQMWYNSLFPRL